MLVEFFGFSFLESARGTLTDGDTGVIVGSDWVAWSYVDDRLSWQVLVDTDPALPGGWGVFSKSVGEPTCDDDGCDWIAFFPFVGREFLAGETGFARIDPALAAPEPAILASVGTGLVLALVIGLRRKVG